MNPAKATDPGNDLDKNPGSLEKRAGKTAGPGRRPLRDDGNSRHQLLVAARREFALHGFRGTTVRHVADQAGVTPAMVHYHFRDKHGLYEAMLRETLDPLLLHLQALASDGNAGSLREAIAGYMRLMVNTPELPALIIRDVLSEDGVMRNTFIRDFASRGARAMRAILERDRAAGRLREDLDPRMTLISLMGMTVFPFIARPIVNKVLELEYDEAMVEQLATHTATLFYNGVCRPEAT
ncbi:MAG: CerR family C-terminal domain-containing protein [Proteobacteria bacterium]|nr:CerR family C-terminal domain-containing protein [Pseudomonadota bacterium]